MHIFFVNGPPRSGKDTVGSIISQHFGAGVDKFARILKERTHALYGLYDDHGQPFAHDAYEVNKDMPLASFHGLTPRQAYIAVSETFFKPVHGERIFGTLLANDWLRSEIGEDEDEIMVITDSGFGEEALEIMERFPTAEVTVLQLQREGCTFRGDSRGYINLFDPRSVEPRAVRNILIDNNGTLAELREVVITNVSVLLGLSLQDRYTLEVQVPGASVDGDEGGPQWIEFGQGSNSLEHALARVESARRSHYSGRVVRINDTMRGTSRYIYPGDAPVYELAGSVEVSA